MVQFFITGISRGLGYSLASSLLREDKHVVGVGRTDNPNLHAVENSRYQFLLCDMGLSNLALSSIKEYLLELKATECKSIIFINNAALNKPIGRLATLQSEDILRSLNINLVSPILLSKVFLEASEIYKIPLKIIHVSSGAATRPIPANNTYCIGKAGLEMLVKGIHSEAEFSASKVQCIGFRPGVMDTDMQTSQRSFSKEVMPSVDMYLDFQKKGLLRDPNLVAQAMIDNLLNKDIESGKIYTIDEFIKS